MKNAFDESAYAVLDIEGARIRAWEGIPYCSHPVSSVQRLNLYVPEPFFTAVP